MKKVPSKKFAIRVVQMAGVLMIVAGVAAFSIPISAIVFGSLLIFVGEVHG